MRTIVIYGAGELGGAAARQLAAADIAARVLIVDTHASIAQGKALDIRQAAPIEGYSTAVEGTADESVALGAETVVIADRAEGAGTSEWQDDAGAALVRRLAYLSPRAVIVCAGARQASVIERSVREAGLSRSRIYGSAPEALRSALVALVALEVPAAPADISLTVVGLPPDRIIVPWDEAAIGGLRAIDILSPPAITRLDARLSKLWPPGPLALASAVTRVLTAAAARRLDAVSALVAVPRGEQDAGRVAMLPVTVDATGVTRVAIPQLSARDRVRLETVLAR